MKPEIFRPWRKTFTINLSREELDLMDWVLWAEKKRSPKGGLGYWIREHVIPIAKAERKEFDDPPPPPLEEVKRPSAPRGYG